MSNLADQASPPENQASLPIARDVRVRPTPIERWRRFAPYSPLAALGAEIVWCIGMFGVFLFMVGDEPFTSTPAKEHMADVIAGIPIAIGLLLGMAGITFHWAHRPREWICLVVGTVICAALVTDCIWGAFH